jgi:hypothetical protein
MKTILIGISAAAILLATPLVKRDLLEGLEKGFANTLIADQMQIFGYPSGLYINGYGVVFATEINLSYAQAVSPFQQTFSPAMKAKTHDFEMNQLPVLRNDMRQMLLKASVTLDTLPATEQIAVGVKLTHQGWEDKAGFPEQIVMQGQKSQLMAAQLGKTPADAVIHIQEQN